MASQAFSIQIEPRTKSIRFCSEATGSLVLDSAPYTVREFQGDFYAALSETLKSFQEKHAFAVSARPMVLLPDYLFFTDTVSFPAMQGKAMESALSNTIDGLFVHRNEIRIGKRLVNQNKQLATYCLFGLREELISNIKTAFNVAHISSQRIACPSVATAIGLGFLNPKLAKATYLFFDVKEDYTRVIYVFKGEAVAFTELPFGTNVLDRTKVHPEDMLFNHASAELAVLNARERAKAKAVTALDAGLAAVEEEGEETTDTEIGMNETNKADEDEDDDDEEEEKEEKPVERPAKVENIIKALPRKQARKLPKFMLRPNPTSEEGFLCENFRLFVKWALGYLQANDRLINLGAPEAVYFNLPEEFEGVFETVNAEEKENGIRFLPVPLETRDPEIRNNLDLYGALRPGSILDIVFKPSNIF